MPHATCPYCEEKVKFSDKPQLGYKLSCPHCGEKLEVVTVTPPELDYEYDEDDDYDDDEDDEDY